MRLLLVEDDAALARVIHRGLVEHGYAVDVATTVADAEEAAWFTEYDLIILDLGLPDGDGVALCRSLRERGTPAPVLMLTARDTLADKVDGLDAGADDYLAKPFDFPELSARVRALLRRPWRGRAPVLAVADLRVDPASRQVWRGDLLIPLTAREFSLLHFLVSRKGEVVSRDQILEHVWDLGYDSLSNVVDVHIGSLRRKLDLTGRPSTIETVRGTGYRIGP